MSNFIISREHAVFLQLIQHS